MLPKVTAPRAALAVILALSLLLMLHASFSDSAIMDELAHIPAGYSYVRYLDFRLNPEHPPLLKALAGLPLLPLNPAFPTSHSSWTTDINGQWAAGAQLLYELGNDPDDIIRLARVGPMLVTLLLIVFIYFWSSKFLGEKWALLPTFLLAFSPTVLAHGHYVTTDLAAAFGVVIATYYFLSYLFDHLPSHPRNLDGNTVNGRRECSCEASAKEHHSCRGVEGSRKKLWFAGIAFGIAQLMKFSAVLLVPYFIFLAFTFLVVKVLSETPSAVGKIKRMLQEAKRKIAGIIAVFAIGYLVVVYPIYFLFTVNYPIERQVADATFILGSFAGGQPPAGETCRPMRCLAEANIAMAGNAITRPLAHYMLGVLMVIQRASGGNTAYFLGEVSDAGSKLYFPLAYAFKEPLAVLLIVLIGLLCALKRIVRPDVQAKAFGITKRCLNYLNGHFTEFAMLVFVVFYWVYSIRSNLNIGVRHLLPTFPFIYMLAAVSWKRWVAKRDTLQPVSLIARFAKALRTAARAGIKYVFLGILLVWFASEVIIVAPFYLSYFNQLGRGTAQGYRYITDSNYDWGQDLLRLRTWAGEHPEADRIAIDYFGGGSPVYYLKGKAEPWQSSRGNPANSGIHWFAVSINNLQGQIQPAVAGHIRKPEDEYRWLTEARGWRPDMGNAPEPDARIGTSIFVYEL